MIGASFTPRGRRFTLIELDSKARLERKPRIDWCAGRDVHIIMRDGKIRHIGEVFDIDLRFNLISQLEKRRRIDPRVSGQLRQIADRRKAFGLVIDTEAKPQSVVNIKAVP